MPAMLIAVFGWLAGSVIRSFFFSVGLGLVSFSFIFPLVSSTIEELVSTFDNVAIEVLQVLEIAGLSPAMSMLLGSMVTSAMISSMRKTFVSRTAGKSLMEVM